MTPLPIAKNDMTNFEDQVFCSADFYGKTTLVLFVHDSPDVVVGPNAVTSSKMDLNEAYLVHLFVDVTYLSSIHRIDTWNGFTRTIMGLSMSIFLRLL